MAPNFLDITFLRSLPHLTDLSIIARNGSLARFPCDFSIISDLINLTRLDLSRNHIYDVSFLSPLSNLTYLNLGENIIKDLSPLYALKQQGLKELIVSREKGYDFSYHGQEEV
jgi:Leucine-rich repeat (LRR) protein